MEEAKMAKFLEGHFTKINRGDVKKRYVAEIGQLLHKTKIVREPENCTSLALQLLDARGELSVNDSGSSSDDVRKINTLVEEYNDLYEICVFCASFPSKDTTIPVGKDSKKVLTVDQDRQSRKYQFRNFINQHFKLSENPIKNYSCERDFYKYEELLESLSSFFDEKATNSKEIFVVSLGHGVKQGAILANETHPISWDRMLSDIENMSKQRTIQDKLVPESLHIVFTQCMAHCGKRENSIQEYVKIKSFTGPEKKYTHSIIVMETGGQQVKDANHVELNEWGSLLLQEGRKVGEQITSIEFKDVRLSEQNALQIAELKKQAATLDEQITKLLEPNARPKENANLMEQNAMLKELNARLKEQNVRLLKPKARPEEIANLMGQITRLKEQTARQMEQLDRQREQIAKLMEQNNLQLARKNEEIARLTEQIAGPGSNVLGFGANGLRT